MLQFSPLGDVSANASSNVRRNLRGIYQALESLRRERHDIVVLPELVLYYVGLEEAHAKGKDALREYAIELPDPDKETTNACVGELPPDLHNVSFLRHLSCMARALDVYLVANVVDLVLSSSGEETFERNEAGNEVSDSYRLFNTDVVFDRRGTLVAKYWKWHTFGTAPLIDQPTPLERKAVKFETDFGVTFGLAICFDIEFENPAQKLLDQGVRHFAFSSAWLNNPPFGFATEIQQGWSKATQAVLLAANIGTGPMNSGSGIYSMGKSLASHFDINKFRGDNILMSAIIPKSTEKTRLRQGPSSPSLQSGEENLPLLQDDAREEHQTCLLDFIPQVTFNASCSQLIGNKAEGANITLVEQNLRCEFSFVSLDPRRQNNGVPVAVAFSQLIHFPSTVDAVSYKGCILLMCVGYPKCSEDWSALGKLGFAQIKSFLPNTSDRVIPLFSGMLKNGSTEHVVSREVGSYTIDTESERDTTIVQVSNRPDDQVQHTFNFGIISIRTSEDHSMYY